MRSGQTTGARPAQVAVRPDIELSWKRSELSGVDPARCFDAGPLPEVDPDSVLLRAAGPVLDEVGRQLAGTGLCVLLADRDCRVIARVFDTRGVERHLEGLGVVIGSGFGEEHAGTNALGTPLEIRRGVMVHGAEHFLDQFKGLSCYGQPIIHPVTNRVEGILDMTCIAPQANAMFAPFLQRAAADIERRLLEGARASHQRLVDAFQRISPQSNVAVAAIGEDLLLSNRAALELLDVADHVALRAIGSDLRADQSRTARVTLASGAEASVQADRVEGANGGTLFVVRPIPPTPVRRPRSRRPRIDRTRTELQRARDSAAAVVVSGEPGSGRTTAAGDLVAHRSAGRLDATRVPVVGAQEWTAELARTTEGRVDPVVVENIQLLPEAAVALLAGRVCEAGRPQVVLTCGPVDELPGPVAALVARCPERIVLPPLRARRDELPAMAQAMLDGIGPGLSLTATALEALLAQQWPGNLTELRTVLTRTADRATSRRLTVADLPEAYRTSTRVARLAGRERAEREAIVDALRAHAGNKVHAAAALGISRSTLYSRIRALDIRV
ncbi:sigma-54-dependent Fis family transcriptional regulator [Speluncibacter jeojiensis]|uniref:Fis family transcriptional regulator n=1 Tax=Speluncibacter jeojiensis TaxID=2710754 RepID=A0A9X4RDS2_9ACTN|nr:Fis family transcriptional regulator [Corynebacteriales bacterium D3-21]